MAGRAYGGRSLWWVELMVGGAYGGRSLRWAGLMAGGAYSGRGLRREELMVAMATRAALPGCESLGFPFSIHLPLHLDRICVGLFLETEPMTHCCDYCIFIETFEIR